MQPHLIYRSGVAQSAQVELCEPRQLLSANPSQIADALDLPTALPVLFQGSSAQVEYRSTPSSLLGFPSGPESTDYLLLSTGAASHIDTNPATRGQGTDFGGSIADDRAIIEFTLPVPVSSKPLRLTFDFLFLSDEPNAAHGDYFTATVNDNPMQLGDTGSAITAGSPDYHAGADTGGTSFAGRTDLLTASYDIPAGITSVKIHLEIADQGSRDIDSAAILDNVRFDAIQTAPGAISISAGNGDDTIDAHVVSNTLITSVNGVRTFFAADLTTRAVINAFAGNDLVTIGSMASIPTLVNGGDGNDTLLGGPGNDSIAGGYGDDVIDGGPGTDAIVGDLNNGTSTGTGGNDSIYSSSDHSVDTVFGGPGRDHFHSDGDVISDHTGQVDGQFGAISGGNHLLTLQDSDGDHVTFDLTDGGGGTVVGPSFERILLTGTTVNSRLKITVRKAATGDGVVWIGGIWAEKPLKSITAPTTFIDGEIQINASASQVAAGTAATITLGGIRDGAITSTAVPITALSLLDWSDGDVRSPADTLTAPSVGTITIRGRKDNRLTAANELLPGDLDANVTLTGNAPLKSVTLPGTLHGNLTTAGAIGKITTAAITGGARAASIQSIAARSKTAANAGQITTTGQDARGISIGTISLASSADGLDIAAGGRIRFVSVAGRLANSRIQTTGGIDSITVGSLFGTDILAGVKSDFTGRFATAAADLANGSATDATLKSLTVRGGAFAPGQHPTYIGDSHITAASVGKLSLMNLDGPVALQIWRLDRPGSPQRIRYTDRNQASNSFVWRSGGTLPGAEAGLLQVISA